MCYGGYIDYMEELVKLYSLKKAANIVVGGHDRQSSVKKGLDAITEKQYEDNDTVVIYDGARPLVDISTISGGQGINREIEAGNHMLDFRLLLKNLENKFGGKWYVLLRLYLQLTARHINSMVSDERLIDISSEDDMYEILAGCDDYHEYEGERGQLLWDLKENNFPFPMSENNIMLTENIENFDKIIYEKQLK